jgi:hypothetical protein
MSFQEVGAERYSSLGTLSEENPVVIIDGKKYLLQSCMQFLFLLIPSV